MPPLKNIKHEIFAKNFVKDKANATQAYMETYPKAQYDGARANACDLIANPLVKNRCLELLEKQSGSKLDILINDLINMKSAERAIAIDNMLHNVADNPVRLEAIKTLLKMHGALTNTNGDTIANDNRSIVFNIEAGNIDKLQGLLSHMKTMADSNPIAGNIQDGDIIDIDNAK